ncbi:hypothetical protein R3W88_027616 [Solanum pinnatisectum]|uniref:DUF1985 domain-containing protein n=1 Tax=Solanum pinnatisectum TaxID=50273 RepID=A0AAV9LGI8_9SOLN|nr:hypothetical protein R3W88_027616 [Solanum pinnatisectum]
MELQNMKYVIKHIAKQFLKFGPTYNSNSNEDIVLSIKEEGMKLFKDTIFGQYLNIPKCNYQGQITKCLYLLKVEQDNLDKEIHIRHAKGNVLQFSIREFAIITGLKCTGNIKYFIYPDSKTSRLVQRYFLGPKYNVIEMVGTTLMMPFIWKEYKLDKQMYRLNGFPYALNIWVYECASVIHNEIAVKEGNDIPRLCNWKVVGAKPKFEMFMKIIFTENDCSNVHPTQEEIRSLDLPNNSHVPQTQPDTSDVNHEEVQPEEVPGFEEFSSKPPEQLLRRFT